MLFKTRLARILFWIGLSVGLLASGLAYFFDSFGVHNRLDMAFVILFPGSLANGDLERGPIVAEIFKVAFYSFLNGCIYGVVGVAVARVKSVLAGGKHQ